MARGKRSGVGERLRWLRETSGLKTREVDDLAELSHGHTSQVENMLGARVSARTIVSLANVFGVTPNWLLDGDGEPPTEDEVRQAVTVARRRIAGPDSSAALEAVSVDTAPTEPQIPTPPSSPPPPKRRAA